MSAAHVALLRGVNVGGAKRLPMARLAALFEAAGAREVETLIQSGNVVFVAEPERARDVVAAVARAIESEFGFAAPVILRDRVAWMRLIEGNPFRDAGADPSLLHAACLSAPPAPHAAARLDPRRSPPDEFRLVGDVVYLRLPNGVARSRLTNAWLDATLGVVSTLRNWRTVEKLADLLAARPAKA